MGESQRGLVQFTHGAFASPEHVARIGQWYDTILQETRRPLIGESIRHFWSEPDLWRKQLNDVEERSRQGYAAYAMTSTRRSMRRWTLKDSSRFDEMPAWKSVMTLPLDRRKERFLDPGVRAELAGSMTGNRPIGFSRRWDLITVKKAARPENKRLEGKSIDDIARAQTKSPIDQVRFHARCGRILPRAGRFMKSQREVEIFQRSPQRLLIGIVPRCGTSGLARKKTARE